jgi:hypothetical protein
MHRFIVTIEGAGWTDFDEVELPAPPDEGEPIETKFGTCLVTEAELRLARSTARLSAAWSSLVSAAGVTR